MGGCYEREMCTGYLTKNAGEVCTDDEQCKSKRCSKTDGQHRCTSDDNVSPMGSCQLTDNHTCPEWLCSSLLGLTTDVDLYCSWPNEDSVIQKITEQKKNIVKISATAFINPTGELDVRELASTATGADLADGKTIDELMQKHMDTCAGTSFAKAVSGEDIYNNIKAIVDRFDIYSKCTQVYVPRQVNGLARMQKDDVIGISTEVAYGFFSLSFEDVSEYKEYTDNEGTKTLIAIISSRKENVIEGNYDIELRLFTNGTVRLGYTKRQNLAEAVLRHAISFDAYKITTQQSVDRTILKLAYAGRYGAASIDDGAGCYVRELCTGYLTKVEGEKCEDDEQCKRV